VVHVRDPRAWVAMPKRADLRAVLFRAALSKASGQRIGPVVVNLLMSGWRGARVWMPPAQGAVRFQLLAAAGFSSKVPFLEHEADTTDGLESGWGSRIARPSCAGNEM